jgi:phosphatidylethanolamine/phosphatidyl-N-methylethanolamine N-methyltransferase
MLYTTLAPIYDWIFGPTLHAGRREAIGRLPIHEGAAVLEVGIGTALTATLYPETCTVTGIDTSGEMLDAARRRLASRGIRNVKLVEMDAAGLRFPDDSFDLTYAAYVVSTVPDPVQIVREMRRVCRPGGYVALLNHFQSVSPWLARIERGIAPLTRHAGFTTDLDLDALLRDTGLEPMAIHKVNVPSIWSLVICRNT